VRLHSLHLAAFGPFAAEQHVDFDKVASSGLFLLDGPTGAGKSTVLDAITFALYGPGDRGGDDRLHSHFAPVGTEPRVTLEFSVDGVRHRVTRTPEYQRPKKSGTGLTRQAASVHLERMEAGSWVSRSANKAEVAEHLAEVIGLTREQFTQVVLLPQGEFATFLKAGDDERRKLLSKLFGTHLYDRITDELDQRRAASVRGIDSAQVDVQACIAAAAEAAGLGADAAAELRELSTAEVAQRLAALADELAEAHAAAERAAADAQAAAGRARADHAAAAADADRLTRFAAAVAADEAHAASRPQQDARVERLTAARRAEPVRPLLTALRECADACEQAESELLAAEPGADGYADADALAERAATAERAAAELQHLVDREASLPALVAAVQDAAAAVAEQQDELERLAERQASLPGELEGAERKLEAARCDAERLAVFSAERETLQRRLDAARTAADLAPRLHEARVASATATDAHQRAVDAHQHLLDARLSGMAAELAGELRAGEPCAVCGGTEHPAPAQPALDAVTADQVELAARARDAAGTARDAAAAALRQLETGATAALAVAGEGEPAALVEQLSGELAELADAIAGAEAASAALPELLEWKRVLDAEAESLARRHAAALAAHATASERLAAATAARDELSAELATAASGCASVTARQRQLRDEAARYARLAAASRALAEARARHQQAQARADAEAVERGFADAAAAARAVLHETNQASLAVEVETWTAETERLRATVEAAEFAGLSRADFAEPGAIERERGRAEQAASAAQQAEQDARAAADAAERARHAARRFADRRADLTSAIARLVERETEAAPILYLAKLTKGMTGQRRVALTTYVLRHWFEQVVQAANLRLAAMSGNRYELVRIDDLAGSGSRAQRTGLTLQVLDRHTGEQRATGSLSGGESFYTSLALALGLADVVRAEAGGVDLDTLFIDEGFGSLDPDTLEDVMSVIDDLRDRGRVVGIVSHVGDLKDRIAERVEVRRRPDGSSELRVVA